jgi:hypothetical protein
MFAFVWQSGRGGGRGHDDSTSEAPVRKEQSVCIVNKLKSVCLGHSLGFISQSCSGIKLSIIQFSLLQFN